MSSVIHIRTALSSDIEAVMAFDQTDDKTFFKNNPPQKFYAAMIAQETILLACDGEKPIGSVRWDFIWPERLPLLSWLYVLPEYRAQAAGEKLFFAALKRIEEEGYDRLLVSACDDRPDIIAKLKSEGLIQSGILDFPDGSQEIFFWLELPFVRAKNRKNAVA